MSTDIDILSERELAPPAPPAEIAPPVLEVADLTLSFGGRAALADVGFDVRRGELFAVIGPNGAGKTSILNCLNGVYRPQRGRIALEGKSLIGAHPPKVAELGVARTFQNLALFTNLSVVDNLMLGRHVRMRSGALRGALWWGGARREEIANRKRCAEVIDLLDLEPYRHLPVGMLPYGIQKRIELGRALVADPLLLLLDEPVAGMNIEETEDMATHILEIRDELGITTILVEHHMDLVMDLADRVLVLNFGQVVATGPPDMVQADPAVIEAYLGGGE